MQNLNSDFRLLIIVCIAFMCAACVENNRVLVSPYMLNLQLSAMEIPIYFDDSYVELDRILPEDMKRAIYISYRVTLLKDDNLGVDSFEKFATQLHVEMSRFSKSEVGTYLDFRNKLIDFWGLDKESIFTQQFIDKGLDAQAIVSIILQKYGAYLNQHSLDLEQLIEIEVIKKKEWRQWKRDNLNVSIDLF